MSAPAGKVRSSARVNFESSDSPPLLPDPSVAVDEEFSAVWATAEVIGALSSDDYRWSFTSILLALLYSETDVSRWFLTFAQSANVNLAEICNKRGFRPENLPEMRKRFAAGGSYLKKHPFTSSSTQLFQGAVDLCRSAGVQPTVRLGARHLLAAYIYRLPSGHLDELTQWGFVPALWSANFVQFVTARNPAESFWATLDQQQFAQSRAQTPSAATGTFTFQVESPQGKRGFLVSEATNQLLTFASLHKKKNVLVSEMLLFSAIESGRSDNRDPVLTVLTSAVATSAGGWDQYEQIVLPHLDRQPSSDVSVAQPVRCTANCLKVLEEAQRIASLVSSPGSQQTLIELRHLVAALLLTKTVATSVMARLGLEIDNLTVQLSASLQQIPAFTDNLNEWNSVLFGTPRPTQAVSEFVPLRADFTADNIPSDPSASDRLGFKRDVRAFASVIASQDLTPPMSIGVFGDWGSGKSFFMKQLEQKIVSLAGSSEDYCSNIVPVWFNAWHYVDQHLWATLVTEIFDKLFAHIGADKKESAAKRIEDIQKELSKEHGLHTEAQADLAKAKEDRISAEEELKKLRKDRAEKENSLREQLSNLAALVRQDPKIEANIKEVQKNLGLPALESSYEAFEAQVGRMQSLGNRAVAVVNGAFREPGWVRRLGYLLIVFGLPATLVVLIGDHIHSSLALPAKIISFGIAFLGSSTLWMRSMYIAGSAVVTKAETTLSELRQLRERRAAEQDAESIAEIELLQQGEETARQKLRDAESRIQDLTREMQELQPGRRLQRFIEQRFATGDYRQHLGLISLIRRDFETLSRLLRERDDLPVDRIVLFIDDLDRCPPDRVGEVLEAIHLILAFELFVVVVGVDVRWVSRALEKRYSGLLSTNLQTDSKKQELASPDDYLEKIFQIPFWINPLQAMSSKELLTGMLEKYRMVPPPTSDAPQSSSKTETPTLAGGGGPVDGDSGASRSMVREVVDTVGQKQEGPKRQESVVQQAEPASPGRDEERSLPITLTKGELDYMLELSQYSGRSPRRLKRFINIYRIIKSTVTQTESSDFLVGSGETGDYRLVLALLAVLTGSPLISGELLRKMQQPGVSLTALVEELSKRSGAEYRNSLDALSRMQSDPGGEPKSATLNRWASVVARYSFQPYE